MTMPLKHFERSDRVWAPAYNKFTISIKIPADNTRNKKHCAASFTSIAGISKFDFVIVSNKKMYLPFREDISVKTSAS